MKELDDFTVERLEKLIHLDGSGCVVYDAGVVGALARIALAAKTAEPVGITDKSEITNLSEPGWVGNFMEPNFKGVDKGDEVYLYTAPVLNSPELPDGWTNNGLADSALVMLDRIDAIGPDDEARIEEVKQIIRQLGAPPTTEK